MGVSEAIQKGKVIMSFEKKDYLVKKYNVFLFFSKAVTHC